MSQTLLLAEGDPDLRFVYRQFLTARGFAVETAANGLDCLEMLRRTKPAAIVLDRELHWGGGDGVLAWLREQQTPPRIPVVLTGTRGFRLGDAAAPPVVKVLP